MWIKKHSCKLLLQGHSGGLGRRHVGTLEFELICTNACRVGRWSVDYVAFKRILCFHCEEVPQQAKRGQPFFQRNPRGVRKPDCGRNCILAASPRRFRKQSMDETTLQRPQHRGQGRAATSPLVHEMDPGESGSDPAVDDSQHRITLGGFGDIPFSVCSSFSL